MSMTKEEAAVRRNMTWEEAARELAKAARNALDEASPAGPGPEAVQFAEACMMGISVLMRRTIHFNRWKKRWAERKAAVLAEVGEHCNPPAKVVTEDDVIEEPEVGEKKDETNGTDETDGRCCRNCNNFIPLAPYDRRLAKAGVCFARNMDGRCADAMGDIDNEWCDMWECNQSDVEKAGGITVTED